MNRQLLADIELVMASAELCAAAYEHQGETAQAETIRAALKRLREGPPAPPAMAVHYLTTSPLPYVP